MIKNTFLSSKEPKPKCMERRWFMGTSSHFQFFPDRLDPDFSPDTLTVSSLHSVNILISTFLLFCWLKKKCFDMIILRLTSRGNLSMSISVGLLPHLFNGARMIPVVNIEIIFT